MVVGRFPQARVVERDGELAILLALDVGKEKNSWRQLRIGTAAL